MYFIKSGECKVLKHLHVMETIGGKPTPVMKFLELATLRPKEYFGELAILFNEPRRVSIYTATNVELLVLSKIDFLRCTLLRSHTNIL